MGGSSRAPAGARGPSRIRASVTCGRKRRRRARWAWPTAPSGSQLVASADRLAHRVVQARQLSVGVVVHLHRQRARAARRQPQRRADRQLAHRRGAAPPARPDRARSPRPGGSPRKHSVRCSSSGSSRRSGRARLLPLRLPRPRARRAPTRPAPRAPAPAGRPPRTAGRSAGCGVDASASDSPKQQRGGSGASPPWSRGRGCRRAPPGRFTERVSGASLRARDAQPHEAHGLLLAAAARAGDAGDPHADVGAQARRARRRRAPRATSSETAPCASISAGATPA